MPETCADLRKLLESTVYAATLEGSMAKMTDLDWPLTQIPDEFTRVPDYPLKSKSETHADSGLGMPPLVSFAIAGVMVCTVALLIGFAVIGLKLLGWI